MSGTRPFNQTLKRLRAELAMENRRYGPSLVELPRRDWPLLPDMQGGAPLRAWRSCDFLVMLFEEPHKRAPRLTVIRARLDDRGRFADGITWDELQCIKSEVGYGDREAVEIYPRDRDLVNIQNMRHLWILSEGSGLAWTNVGSRADAPDGDRPRRRCRDGAGVMAWQRSVNLQRAAAFAQLLAMPDPAGMRRGHRLTQHGARNRLRGTWWPALHVWAERRIQAREGAADGWKPSSRTAVSRRMQRVG